MPTLAEATTVRLSGNPGIDALSDTFLNWNYLAPQTGHAPKALYFSFAVDDAVQLMSPAGSPVAFNADQQDATRAILAHASVVTGIVFVETADAQLAELRFANDDLAPSTLGLFRSFALPVMQNDQFQGLTGDGYLFLDDVEFRNENTDPDAGERGYETLLHEIGHALGLGHPFDGDLRLPAAEDDTDHTVMSYTTRAGFKSEFQSYDRAALNWIYGGDGLGGQWGYNGSAGQSTETHAPAAAAGDRQGPALLASTHAEARDRVGGAPVVLYFDELIQRGSGDAVLRTTHGLEVARFAADSPALRASGSMLLLSPASLLYKSTDYVLELAPGAVTDLAGQPMAGALTKSLATTLSGGLPVFKNGTSSADQIFGGSGDDQLSGGAGNDRFSGGGGTDRLSGDAGLDTSVYPLWERAHYTIQKFGSDWLVADRLGYDGLDRLSGVERLSFIDMQVALDLDGAAGTVARLVGALFGAAALQDRALMGIGLKLVDDGLSPVALAALAIDTPLFAAAAGSRSAADLVSWVYRNIFGSQPSDSVRSHYAGLIDSGQVSAADLVWGGAQLPELAAAIDLAGLASHGLEYLVWAG